jgi:hypothetical protein
MDSKLAAHWRLEGAPMAGYVGPLCKTASLGFIAGQDGAKLSAR